MRVEDMLNYRSKKKVKHLLDGARAFAEVRINFSRFDLQEALKVGSAEAEAIHDWLSDQHLTNPTISTHVVRCGRRYVANNPFPSLEGLREALGVGDRRGFAIMLELERRKYIRINANFMFIRTKRMSKWSDLVRQLEWVSKKYGGRCEPKLLTRILYVDGPTAMRLAQYGEEFLDLTWKDRPQYLN